MLMRRLISMIYLLHLYFCSTLLLPCPTHLARTPSASRHPPGLLPRVHVGVDAGLAARDRRLGSGERPEPDALRGLKSKV